MLKQYILLIAVLLATTQISFADVAPEPGYVKVSRSIVLTTDDDLSGYRFFLISGNLVKEIQVAKGKRSVASGLGGGARYSNGTVYAVPRKSVESYPAELSTDQMDTLSSVLFQQKLTGSITIARESFNDTVRTADANKVTDAEYHLSKTTDGIKVESVQSQAKPLTAPETKNDEEPQRSDLGLMIGGGLLLTGFAVGAGFWIARSKRKDNDEN